MSRQPAAQPSAASGQPKSVVIGTAGHIDHGKTALIRALTGVDTDRLPEEKRRGITVDLGFASLNMEAADKSPLQLSFIDVPGHALFVRNMLAGAGGIDAVMLVISAEEGVKPQTEEHLAICTLLGIERGITVITKSDAVSAPQLNDVRSDTERFIENTFLSSARAPIIAVSAHVGSGIEELKRALVSLAAQIRTRNNGALTRLPLDRAFVMKGFGTVVTGTLIAGTLRNGQRIKIEPGDRAARIRGIQVHGRAEETVHAGTRVALNLAGLEASELRRGDTLVDGSSISAVYMVDAEVSLLPHAAIKHRARVHFHAHASECMATVFLYKPGAIEPGGAGLVRLKLSKPTVLLPEDRFVMRQGALVTTIGGGRVLDVQPIERQRKAKTHAWLREIRTASLDQQIHLRVARRGTAGLAMSALSVETGINVDALRTIVKTLVEHGRILCIPGDLLLTKDAFDAAVQLVRTEVEKIQQNDTWELKRSELKSHTRLIAEVFDSAVARLERDKQIAITNELVVPFRAGKQSVGNDRLAAVSVAYEAAGLATPSPDELAATMNIAPPEMRRLITSLLREKLLVRLGSDSLFVHQRALSELIQEIQALRGQMIDIAGFKNMAGVSRKYAIPLLEYLDRERVTRKQGDLRIVL